MLRAERAERDRKEEKKAYGHMDLDRRQDVSVGLLPGDAFKGGSIE